VISFGSHRASHLYRNLYHLSGILKGDVFFLNLQSNGETQCGVSLGPGQGLIYQGLGYYWSTGFFSLVSWLRFYSLSPDNIVLRLGKLPVFGTQLIFEPLDVLH